MNQTILLSRWIRAMKKIANLEVQLAEAQTRERDTVLRIKAEMENLRRRTEQDIEKSA